MRLIFFNVFLIEGKQYHLVGFLVSKQGLGRVSATKSYEKSRIFRYGMVDFFLVKGNNPIGRGYLPLLVLKGLTIVYFFHHDFSGNAHCTCGLYGIPEMRAHSKQRNSCVKPDQRNGHH